MSRVLKGQTKQHHIFTDKQLEDGYIFSNTITLEVKFLDTIDQIKANTLQKTVYELNKCYCKKKAMLKWK